MNAEPTDVDLSKYIDMVHFGDRPHIRGRRVPVGMIVRRMQVNSWTVEQTAEDFALTETEILAALLYYEQHKALIDQQEAEEDALFQQMKQQYGDG